MLSNQTTADSHQKQKTKNKKTKTKTKQNKKKEETGILFFNTQEYSRFCTNVLVDRKYYDRKKTQRLHTDRTTPLLLTYRVNKRLFVMTPLVVLYFSCQNVKFNIYVPLTKCFFNAENFSVPNSIPLGRSSSDRTLLSKWEHVCFTDAVSLPSWQLDVTNYQTCLKICFTS